MLRAPCPDEQTLRSRLRRLVVTLDAQIVNGLAPDRDGPPASETIYSGAVGVDKDDDDDDDDDDDAEPLLVVADEPPDDGDKTPLWYAVWKLSVFLARPRIRLQMPSVVFSAAAHFRLAPPAAADRPERRPREGGYMQSGTPSGMNLLESFAGDPMLGGVRPRLSSQRVTKVAPLTRPKEPLYRLRGLDSLRLGIFPVLHTRVRFARPNTAPPSAALIALLEIDFTPYFDCEVALDRIALGLRDGTVEDLNVQAGMRLPLGCVAHDHLTFLYRLAPRPPDAPGGKSLARDLATTIEVVVLVRPEGEPNACTPRLVMTWTTTVDFTPPVNPGFGQPRAQPMQRPHRPSQLSIGVGGVGGVDSQPLVSPSVMRPDALPTLEAAAVAARTAESALPDFGITITFTGPTAPVRVGEPFAWTVFVVNRSRAELLPPPPAVTAATAATARKLMLVAVPRRRRNELRAVRPPPTARDARDARDARGEDGQVAEAVVDEGVVHAMQRGSAVDVAELASLSADVRVGPLAPQACAVAELRLLALRAGVVGLDAVRVVDLVSQEHVDVRELPLVVAVEAGEEVA